MEIEIEEPRKQTSAEDRFIQNYLLTAIRCQLEVNTALLDIDVNISSLLSEFLDSNPDTEISFPYLLNNIQCLLRREATVLSLSRKDRIALAIASDLIQNLIEPVDETIIKEAHFAMHPAMD